MRTDRDIVAAKTAQALRALIFDVVPVCTICCLTIKGHLFKHVASTPITKGDRKRLEALVESVRSGDWKELDRFQEWDGLATSADVVGLKCLDGRCSLAILLCPAELEEPYVLVLQVLVPDCAEPVTSSFWGEI